MIDCVTPHFEAYRAAVIRATDSFPELVPLAALGCSLTDLSDLLAGFLADGDAGNFVFLGGRRFAGKVLENITSAEDYELCVALREAISDATSMYDAEGTPGKNFYTPAFEAMIQGAGSQAQPS